MIAPPEVRWRNFRGFADTGWIEIKPVTVVIGPNNSGKTSLHAPLLLLKQTTDSLDPGTALLTSGELVDVGAFNDAVHCHEQGRAIEMSLRWDQVWNRSRKMRERGAERPGSCRWVFDEGEDPWQVDLREVSIEDVYKRPVLTRRRSKSGRYSVADLPERLKADRPAVERAMVKAVRDATPYNFLFQENDVLNARWKALTEQSSAPRSADFSRSPTSPGINMYQSIVGYTQQAVEELLDEIYYIGPIRERLRRFYEVSSLDPQTVGTRGEDAPQLIYRWRNDKERLKELDGWLAHFGFTQRLKIEEQGPYAFSLLLRGAKAAPPVGFVDLGFGVSQVLPLIVQGLSATAGDMIIAEQPEIHLNPALQAELADLFVHFAAERGLWNYVETHSEHLLLRLRRLVAERKIQAKDVGVYYVERDGQESRVRHIPIEGDGSVAPDSWPDGFFGESLKDAVGLAEAQMRISD